MPSSPAHSSPAAGESLFSQAAIKATELLWEFDSPAERLAGRALAAHSFQVGARTKKELDEEIVFLLGSVQAGAASGTAITAMLALGWLGCLWRQAAAFEGDAEQRNKADPFMIHARVDFFRWGEALGISPEEIARDAARMAPGGGTSLAGLVAYCLARGPVAEGFLEEALAPARVVSQAGPAAFEESEASQEDAVVIQRLGQAGARWSAAAGEKGKDSFLALGQNWAPFLRLRPAPPDCLFGVALSASFLVESPVAAVNSFYRHWAEWLSTIPGMVNPAAPGGILTLGLGPYDWHPRRCVQAARLAAAAGADLDARDDAGWALLGLANEWAKKPAKAFSHGRERREGGSEDWKALAAELLRLGADPWGLRQERKPCDECDDPELKTLAQAAFERWELQAELARGAAGPGGAPNAAEASNATMGASGEGGKKALAARRV